MDEFYKKCYRVKESTHAHTTIYKAQNIQNVIAISEIRVIVTFLEKGENN